MNRIITIILFLISLLFAQEANNLCFQKGTNTIGIGAGIDFGDDIGVAVAWDRGAINDMFSFGGACHVTFRSVEASLWEQRWVYIIPELRFAFHPFGIPAIKGNVSAASKIDLYTVAHAGPSIGIYSFDYESSYTGTKEDRNTDVDFQWGLALGIKWLFLPQFGLWSELDWDRLIGGITFKF